MEVMLPGARCPGCRAGCPSSGSVDELEELREEEANRGKIREILWMEIGEKLDLPATQEIRGSNPTKLHHTNKSQKKLGGGYFCGEFLN